MNRLLCKFLTLTMCLGLVGAATAQINYTRSTFTAPYVPITTAGGATAFTLTNGSTAGLALPFTFEWNGTVYNSSNYLIVSTNGYVNLSTTLPNPLPSSSNLPYYMYTTSSGTENTIAPWFGSYINVVSNSGGNGQVLYQVNGQELTIQWTNVWAATSTSNTATSLTTHRRINFQLKLFGSTHPSKANQIEFHYGTIDGTRVASENAVVGLKGKVQAGSFLDAISNSKKLGNGMMNTNQWPKTFFRFTPSTTTPTPIVTGTYRVGTGGDYTSLWAALSDLNERGIAGAVTLDLTDAVYDSTTNYFPLLLGPVTGASAANRITITSSYPGGSKISSPGCSGGVIQNAGTTSSSALTASQEPAFGLIGASFVTVKNLNFEAANNNALLDRGVLITNSTATIGAMFDSIVNVSVKLSTANTSSIGIAQENGTTVTTASGANSNNKFFNLRVTDAYSGMLLSGTAAFADTSITVGTLNPGETNLFENLGGGTSAVTGIRTANITQARIFNNVIRNLTETGTSTVNGIWMEETTSGTTERKYHIYNNRIYNLQKTGAASTTGGVYGIRAALTNNVNSNTRIYNNFITNLNSTGTNTSSRAITGILVSGSTTAAHKYNYDVDFNTVIINPAEASGTNTCFELASTTSGNIEKTINVRNNIFANYTGSQSGSVKHSCWFSSSATSIGQGVSNRNVLYLQNTDNGYVGRGNATDFQTLSLWKTIASGVDVNSRPEDPRFISTNSYQIDPNTPTPVESAGSMFGSITWAGTDINGNARNASTPDIGAAEGNYTPFADNDLSVAAFINPAGEDVMLNSGSGVTLKPIVRFRNNGVNTQTNIPVRYRIYSGAQASGVPVFNEQRQIASLGSGATLLDTFPQFTFSANGLYTLEAITELSTDEVMTNDTLRTVISISAPLAGNYNIGKSSPHPFNKLTNAVKALNVLGVTAPVTYLLTDTLYSDGEQFPLEITRFTGNGAANPFVLKPANTVNAVIKGRSFGFMIRIFDASYITIDGSNTAGGTTRNLSIINENAVVNSGAIWISTAATTSTPGATNNTIKNTLLKGGSPDIPTVFGIFVAGTTISASATGVNNDNTTILNNKIERAYRGIYARTSTTTSTFYDNLLIADNEIGSVKDSDYVWYRGIEVSGINNLQIRKNRIYNLKPNTAVSAAAIEYVANVRTSRIYENIIDSIGSTASAAAGAYGIVFSGSTIDSAIIYNNFITDVAMATGGTGANVAAGIRITTGTKLYVHYNTIKLRGIVASGTPASAALMITSNGVSSTVTNNIFINTLTGNVSPYAVYAAENTTFNTINNNVYYTGPGNVKNFLGTLKAGMNEWRAATSQDLASFAYNPVFIANKNLRIQPGTASGLESAGAPLSYITTDIDGDARSASTPDIGADEFNGITQDVAVPAISYQPLSKTASLQNRTFLAEIADQSLIDSTGTYKPRIYYKKSTEANTFTSNTMWDNGWKYTEATNDTSPFAFIIDYSLLTGGAAAAGDTIQYFVVAQDLAAPANVGVNGAEFLTDLVSTNLSPSDFPVNTLNSYRIVEAMPATVNVGAGQAYTSLTNSGGLFDAINSRLLDRNIQVLITSDLTESGLVALNEYAEEGTGNYTVTISPDAAQTRTISSDASRKWLLNLNGTDRFVLDGRFNGAGNYLTLVNTLAATKTAVIYLYSPGTNTNLMLDGCKDIVIRNCNLVGGSMHVASSYLDGVHGIYCGNDLSNGGATFNNSISIIKNRFARMGTGIYFLGNATALFNHLTIDSNEFGTLKDDSTLFFQAALIYGVSPGMMKIRGNVLQNFVQNHATYSSTMYGFQIGSGAAKSIISNNIIKGLRNYKTSGNIFGIDLGSGSSDSAMISNNLFYDMESNNTGANAITGMQITTTNTVFIYHNTFNFFPNKLTALAGSSCISTNTSGALKAELANNIFANRLPGSASSKTYGLYLNNVTTLKSDYNNFHIPAGNSVRATATEYVTLTDWKATGKDLNSVQGNPLFNSDSNLVLLPASSLKALGQYKSSAATDRLGDARNNPPTIGAYEKLVDMTAPVISYTKLLSGTPAVQRTLTNFATISDLGGVANTSAGLKPRVYFKRKTDDNAYTDNTSSTPGWKYAEASNNESPFSFILDYNNLYGGAVINITDTIQYFVIAQDTAAVPNVALNRGKLAAPPVSVNLDATHFPVTDSINYYLISYPLGGTIYVGAGQMYETLTGNGGFFDALNNSSIASSVDLYISGAITEPGTYGLNKIMEYGAGNYKLNIIPSNAELTGNSPNALIRFNNVDRVTIGTATSKELTVWNKGSGAAVEFSNSSNDTLINVRLKGNVTAADQGLLSIRNNSDSLVITGNVFMPDTSAPSNSIYAGGTSGINHHILISGNEFTGIGANGINVAASGNGSYWTIKDNSFYQAAPAKTSQTAINFAAGTSSENNLVSGNYIGGQTVQASGLPWINNGAATATTVKGITVNAGSVANPVVVSNNVVKNLKLTGTSSSMAFTGIEYSGTSGVIIKENIIGDSLTADSIVIYGSTSTTVNTGINLPATGELVVSDNKIWGISSYGLANNNVIGINSSGNGRAVLRGNTIYNLFSAGSDATTTVPRSVTGIFIGSDNKNSLIRKNTITRLVSSGGGLPSGNASTIVRAIMVNSSASGGQISQNRITGIENLSSGVGEIHGIYFFTGASGDYTRWTLDNNVIHLTNGNHTNAVKIEGIHDRNASDGRQLAILNNTIYIGGSAASGSTASACYERTIGSAIRLENNILYNERTGGTGKHTAMSVKLTQGWNNTSSNYNLFVSTDTTDIVEWGTLGSTLSPDNFKTTSSSDMFSYFASSVQLPSFSLFNGAASGDLSINTFSTDAWTLNGKGRAIDSIGYSINDSVRSVTAGTPVDIGAYEFTLLFAPPVFYTSVLSNKTDIVYFTRKLATFNFTTGTPPAQIETQYFSGIAPSSVGNGKKINSYMNMLPSGGSGYSFDISYGFSPAEISDISPANLKLIKSINGGNSWTYYNTSVANTSQYSVTANGLSDFGMFSLTDQSNPLPVKQASFNALKMNKDVLVSWTTASEVNVSHFIVEASANGKEFEPLGQVSAKGNSASTLTYRFNHENAQRAMNGAPAVYYRLTSVDKNGDRQTSKTVMVRFDADLNTLDAVVAYPNPFNKMVSLSIPAIENTTAEITLTDLQGRAVKQHTVNLQAGNNEVSITELEELQAGVYFVKVSTTAEAKVIKLIKH